jgi:hypothetical protein
LSRRVQLTIAGAIDEMQCEGRGCAQCPFRIAAVDELACQVGVQGEPIGLAAQALGELGSAVRPEVVGHVTDVGRVYDDQDLDAAVASLGQALPILDAAGDAYFTLHNDLAVSRALFTTARLHQKRVVLEL